MWQASKAPRPGSKLAGKHTANTNGSKCRLERPCVSIAPVDTRQNEETTKPIVSREANAQKPRACRRMPVHPTPPETATMKENSTRD